MTYQNGDPSNDSTEHPAFNEPRRRSRWLRGWCPVTAAAVVVALAVGWALSGTPSARSAVKDAESVTAALNRTTHNSAASVLGTEQQNFAPVNTAPVNEAFQRDLDTLVSKDGFPGVEAFVRNADGTVRNYTAGVGNLTTKAAVPMNGQVRIGSNTKTFTATTVLQLVGEGKISLDTSVETYLGVVRGKNIDATKITVRQLLQQTSGLPDYDDALVGKNLVAIQHTYFEPRQALDAALRKPAEFAPGTSWGYSNTNYLLAGMIVQRVTGRPIGEVITKRVIDLLGLKGTYWPNTGVQSISGPHPQSYFIAKPGVKPVDVTELDPSLGWAAGQLISTPSDLSTFNRALLEGKLLKPAQQQQLLTTVASPGLEPTGVWSYGLGFAKRELRCGVQAWGHGGDITGFETRNLTTTDGRSAVIAVTTLPPGATGVEHVNDAVQDAICG